MIIADDERCRDHGGMDCCCLPQRTTVYGRPDDNFVRKVLNTYLVAGKITHELVYYVRGACSSVDVRANVKV